MTLPPALATPPRLLAVAPPNWQLNVVQFREDLQRFARAAEPLGVRAAVYLRAHDVALETWQRWLAVLDPAALGPLRIGVTVPKGDDDVDRTLRLLHEIGVNFLHLPASRAVEPWKRGVAMAPRKVSLARAWHAQGPDAADAVDGDCDWTVVSPALATPSKPGVAPLGLPRLARLAAQAPGRLVALGGIEIHNAHLVLASGVAGIACLRAAWSDPAALCAVCA